MSKQTRRTLCLLDRAREPTAAHEPRLQRVRTIAMGSLVRTGEKVPRIDGMCYNSASDELFFADQNNRVVRVISLKDSNGHLRDVYKVGKHDKSPLVYNVCYLSDSDTLLVCSNEKGANNYAGYWLVALRRSGNEWHETERLQTEVQGLQCCAMSDSRVIIGADGKLELYCVQSSIVLITRIEWTEDSGYFNLFSASGSDVAILYSDESVRLHRLCSERLEEPARIQWKSLDVYLLWQSDLLFATEYYEDTKSHAVFELVVNGSRLERRDELLSRYDNIRVSSWCAVDNGVAIINCNTQELLHYHYA